MIDILKKKIKIDEQFQELISGSSIVFLFRLFGFFSGYLLSYIITNYYGEEVLGVYSLAFTILSFVVVLSRLGLDEALVKVISDLLFQHKEGQAKNAYRKSVFLVCLNSLILSFFLYQIADSVAYWFENELLIKAIKIMSLALVPFSLIKVNADVFRAMKNMQVFSYFQTGSLMMLMSIFILLGIYLFDPTYYLLFYAFFGACIVLLLWSFLLMRNKFPTSEKKMVTYRGLIKISLPMMLTSSMFLALSWTDTIFLGRYLSEDQVGIYYIAFKLGLIISLSLFAVNSIAGPKFSEYSNDNIVLKRLALQSVKLNFWSCFPVFIFLLLSGEWLLSLYGFSFIAAKKSLFILAIGQLYNGLSGSVLTFLNMTGYEKLVSKIILSAALLNIVLNYYLIPLFHLSPHFLGIEGAALSSTICLIYWNTIGLYFVYKHHGFIMFPIPSILRARNEK